MLNALAEFFTPEAGQARRRWLNEQEERFGNVLAGYLGPAAQPIQNAALLAGYLSPGADMMDAADASRGMWNADNPLDAAVAGATMLGATGMMFLPGNYNALSEGFSRTVDDMTAAYDPALVRSGLGAVTETPAQEVARLLAEGRAADVTDDMMARVDPQEMWRLYESGATGAEMPMDVASRMARADQMGMTENYFKGMYPYDPDTTPVRNWRGEVIEGADRVPQELQTIDRPSPFPSTFDRTRDPTDTDYKIAGVMGRDPAVASRFAAWGDASVFPLRVNHGTPYVMDAAGDRAGLTHFDASGRPFRDAMRSGDYDSGVILNTSDEGDIAFVLKPQNIRSQFARFDPRLAHLANLSAGIALPVIGVNALAQAQQQEQDRQAIMDWLATQ